MTLLKENLNRLKQNIKNLNNDNSNIIWKDNSHFKLVFELVKDLEKAENTLDKLVNVIK